MSYLGYTSYIHKTALSLTVLNKAGSDFCIAPGVSVGFAHSRYPVNTCYATRGIQTSHNSLAVTNDQEGSRREIWKPYEYDRSIFRGYFIT